MIEFRLLGPVEASEDGRPLPLGGRRQRALLALLLLEPGRPVEDDRLVDELWRGRPPAAAATTLRSYVSRLRAVLGDAAPVARVGTGYRIAVPPDAVDVARFQRLAREGGEALARGASPLAAERLRSALALWRGRPFGELGDDGALRLEAERLDELRLLALEGRVEAELALGAAAELVDELEGLVRAEPYRERLWRSLMLALYRAGRQADALEAYGRAARRLDEELGLEPGRALRDLERAVLRHEVPAPAPPAPRLSLPAPVSSFVGREAELAELAELLARARLVTLTGVGGVGKTRLALEAAGRAEPSTSDGVAFVDLSALADRDLVPGRVAAALGLREPSSGPVEEELARRIGEGELLLVLDNCEHLADACAALAQRLLAAAPRLRVLATSREPLGVPGEVAYAVPPLPVPPAGAPAAELEGSDAVRLLLERAREARPRLAGGERALETAARICRDLDGLPLAIELAAARAKAFSLEEVAARLDDRFRFLVSWRRLTAARHQTLRAAMDWSHDLLGPREQELLHRLSVFAGGFTLAAVAEVCLDGDVAVAEELLARLVDASLVVVEEREGATRYRLLETVRRYAGERLAAAEETAVLARRHASHFLALAEAAAEPIRGPEGAAWTRRLEQERDNLRTALAWSRDVGEAELELRLAEALWWFWWIRGELAEGRRRLDDALAAAEGLDRGLRARALEGAAGLAWAHGDLERADGHAEAALALYEALGDRRGEHRCLTVLGLAAVAREEHGAAEELFGRSLRLVEGDADRTWARTNAAVASHNLGSVALDAGRLTAATRRYEAALEGYRSVDSPLGVALSELYLGLVAVVAERWDDAAARLDRALAFFAEIAFLQYATQCLEGAAAVARARGADEDAARLLGAAGRLRGRTGNPPVGALARLREGLHASLAAGLGEPRLAVALAAGAALADGEALALARAALAR